MLHPTHRTCWGIFGESVVRFFRHVSPGAPPGRLAELPEQPEAQLEVIACDADGYVRENIESIAELVRRSVSTTPVS